MAFHLGALIKNHFIVRCYTVYMTMLLVGKHALALTDGSFLIKKSVIMNS